MSDFLDTPNPADFGGNGKPASVPVINYKSGKTPEAYVPQAAGILDAQVSAGKVGFYVWDSEAKAPIPVINPAFIVLETYAEISGQDGDGSDAVRYWSNRIKDTRGDRFRVFSSASYTWAGDKKRYKPIAEGPYIGKANGGPKVGETPLPTGAKFGIILVVQMVSPHGQGRIYEIKTTAAVQAGIEKAMRAQEIKNTFMLGITDNDHLFGFAQTGFEPIQKNGDIYAGKGEMFWSPVFRFGQINAHKHPELHASASAAQDAERLRYADMKRYEAKFQQEEQSPAAPGANATRQEPPAPHVATAAPVKTSITANHILPPGDPLAAVAPPV